MSQIKRYENRITGNEEKKRGEGLKNLTRRLNVRVTITNV